MDIPFSPDRPTISIIIPCYRRAEMVLNGVRSALQQDFDPAAYEVIVVDSSPDESVIEALQPLRGEARCRFEILRKKPEGPGPSRNLGAARSLGTYLAFLDSDCQATPEWLRNLAGGFRPGTGIVQGRTVPMPWKRQGIFSHTIRVEKEGFLYESANIAYLRQAFEQVGGFLADRNPHAITPLGGEDTDLAWRVRRKGWATAFASDALVYHEVLPMSWRDWIWIDRLEVFPALIAKYPELRPFFYFRYFYDRAQMLVLLALAGLVLSDYYFAFLFLVVPYVVFRASEPTRSLKGILRLGRPVVYLLRDLASLFLLVSGSVRSRALLL